MTDFKRIPPHSIDAEVCVLGSMILDSAACASMLDLVAADDFYRPAHATIYEAIRRLAAAREPVDLVTLKNELSRTRQLEAIGGIDYIADIAESVPNAANAVHYARIVLDASLKRSLVRVGQSLENESWGNVGDSRAILAKYQSELFALSRDATARRGQESAAGPAIRGVMADLENRYLNGAPAVRRYSTGFAELDEAIHGLRAGHLLTLAASTGAGKTTLAMNIACHVAHTGASVCYVSAEMLPAELAQRILQAESGVSGNAIASAQLRPEQWDALGETEARLRELPIYIVGRACDLATITLKAQQTERMFDKPLGLIVVDYLGIMRLPSAGSIRERFGLMTAGLKQLAMELQVPIVLLSQLNRESSKSGAPPTLYDLKESGSIENDSNEVVMLYRPQPDALVYGRDGEAWVTVWCSVQKARDGTPIAWPRDAMTGMRLAWQPNRTRFRAMGDVN